MWCEIRQDEVFSLAFFTLAIARLRTVEENVLGYR
jgi:hypothetical protein